METCIREDFVVPIHKNARTAFLHPSTWLGIAGIIGATASQLPEPHRTHGLLISGGLSIVGTILKTPSDDTKQDVEMSPDSQGQGHD